MPWCLRAERQRLISSNIANADTPGYVARDFDFAQTLKAATEGEQQPCKSQCARCQHHATPSTCLCPP